jgi:hypothetical protein
MSRARAPHVLKAASVSGLELHGGDGKARRGLWLMLDAADAADAADSIARADGACSTRRLHRTSSCWTRRGHMTWALVMSAWSELQDVVDLLSRSRCRCQVSSVK